MKRAYGFTIVELLIVIVIISILAGLSYVGFTNTARRANDALIRSDMAQAAKKLEQFYIENDRYPLTSAEMTTVVKPKRGGAYATHSDTFNYCYDILSGVAGFSAQGKDGSAYVVRAGAVEIKSAWSASSVSACNDADKIGIPVPINNRRVGWVTGTVEASTWNLSS